MTKVSVIIPVYNVEEYVAECLNSVLEQTLKEIEIIIVEDCSTDGSKKICQEYANRYNEKIKLICHEKNLGVSSARNTGMKYATGEYIGFVDSDDYIGPDRFQTMYKKASAYQADIVLGGPLPNCEADEIKEGFYTNTSYSNEILGNILYIDPQGFINGYSASVFRRLYRRDFLEKNNISFLSGLRTSEDRLFSYECHLCAENMYFFLANEKERYFYRQRRGSIMHVYRPNDWEMRRIVIQSLDQFMKKHADLEERALLFKKRMPLLVFMFSIMSMRNVYESSLCKWRKAGKIKHILFDPICEHYLDQIDQLDFQRLCNSYKCLYQLICTKDVKALDTFFFQRKKDLR